MVLMKYLLIIIFISMCFSYTYGTSIAGTAISGDSQVLSLSAIRNNGQTPIQGAEFPPDDWKLQRLSDHAAVYTCINKDGCGFDIIFSQFPDNSGRSPRLCRRNARVSVSQHSIIIPFECTAEVL